MNPHPATFAPGAPTRGSIGALAASLPLLAGLAVLYGPTYARLFTGLWQTPEGGHAPLVALVAVVLGWRMRGPLAALPAPGAGWRGAGMLAAGLGLALLGASIANPMLQMLSQIPVLAGALLLTRGPAGLRLAWFPIAFLVFMVPLPGIFIDAVTAQLKEWVSMLAEDTLYWLGYPVARNGVVITIGQYRLLVADACSGLHSMVSLSALGSLYLYMTGPASRLRNLLLAASILPIAFIANLVRVLLLALLTFHAGDATGRLLHELAGVTVFLTALALLFSLDSVFELCSRLVRGART